MKKTLIAIMALSGLAMAADDAFTTLEGVEYRAGYDYTLSLTLSGISENYKNQTKFTRWKD